METPLTTVPVTEEVNVKERFFRHFQEEITEIQNRIAGLENVSSAGGERTDAMEYCLGGITSLSNEVSDLSNVIPPYDQRIYAQALKALQEKFDATREKITPKRRFQFKPSTKDNFITSQSTAAEVAAKKRLSDSDASPAHVAEPITSDIPSNTPGEDSLGALPSFPSTKNYNEEMSQQPGRRIRQPSFSQASNINISGHKDIHIILPSTASRATSSGTVTDLDRCVVDMSEPTAHGTPFAGLTMQNIKGSLIVAGHVAGAAHITGVENSVVLVASRQVRMHNCKNVDVYLHCASRPIIEDCSNVRFAPIPGVHETKTEEPVENRWDQVDDFKWLKSEPSPNWSILPEESRLKDQVWKEVVPGGPGVGLEDILTKIGLT